MKICTKCGQTKPLDEFNKASSKRDGRQCHCRTCVKASAAAWRKNNPDKVVEKNAKWAAANPDKKRSSVAKWQSSNPEKRREIVSKWRAENPDARRVHDQNRRARTVGTLSTGIAESLFTRQRGKCACGCKQSLGTDYHLDHIMPLALGGTNTDENMQLLRAKCNRQKHAKHPVDFMQTKGYLL